MDKRHPRGRPAAHSRGQLRVHLRLSHPVLPRVRSAHQKRAVKTKLKFKLVVVLSLSILLNVFLLWEVQRKTNIAKKLEKALSELKDSLPTLPVP